MGDARLVAVGVAAGVIDGAEYRGRVEFIHEGAGPVIDGLPGQQHIVGVHDAVDEPQQLPARHQTGLGADHLLQQRQRAVGGVQGLGIMALQHMLHQQVQGLGILAGGKKLESADADMAFRHPGQHRAGQEGLPDHLLTGGHRGQRAGSGQPQRIHGLAHQVFAQYRPQGRPAIAAAGIGRGAGALQLDVVAQAIPAYHLTQQYGPAVSQLGVVAAELVAGIDCGNRFRARRGAVPGHHRGALGGGQPLRIDAQQLRQRGIHPDGARCGDRHGLAAGIEAFRQARVAVVKSDGGVHVSSLLPYRPHSAAARRPRSGAGSPPLSGRPGPSCRCRLRTRGG